MKLQARLPLTRLSKGQYETPDGSVQVIQTAHNSSWAIIARGRPVEVRGLREFPSLRFAHGLLADVRDQLAERRQA